MKNTEVKESQAELLTVVNRLKEDMERQTLRKTLMQELSESSYEETKEILANSKNELNYLLESGEDFLLELDTLFNKTRELLV